MAVGNAQFIKDIINDTDKSTRTTYSSDRIEALLGQTGASSTVYLVTVSDVAPATPAIHDKYYNTNTGLVYEFLDTNKWDNGTNPSRNTLYVDNEHGKIYNYEKGKFSECSGITKISQKANNAVQELTGADEGLYVKDLSEEVKQINIAQKTVNELGYKSLLNSPSEIFTLNSSSSTSNGEGTNTILNKTITLNDSIENYNYLKFILEPKNDSKNINWIPFISEIRVSDINYHNSEVNTNSGSSTFIIIGGIDTPTAGSSMVGHVTFKCWFKDSTTLFVYRGGMTNTLGVDWSKWRIKDVIGISKEIITIDPVNYIDTNQGIQDAPVGNIIERLEDSSVKHYLLCNGSEHNIGTYPDLEQYFREIESVNMFGGDGVTTYKLPNIEPKFFEYLSQLPEMTANNAPAPYVATADSIHSNPYQPYMAFNSKEGDAGYCWHSLSAASHWLQIDYGTPKKINSFKMKGRKSYSQWYGQMPTSFKLQGSNDGTNFVDIKSFSGLSWGSSIEVEFILDNPVEYRYYKLADMKSSSNLICFNKIEYAYTIKKYAFIKYEPTYFIDTITGYEQVDELLDNQVEILSLDETTDLKYYVMSPGSTAAQDVVFAYGIKPIKTNFSLNKSFEDYDEIEILAYGVNPAKEERFNRITKRIRVKDLIYSDSTSFADGSIDLQYFAISVGIRMQDVRLNFNTDKKTITIVQTTYYSGPVARSSIAPWKSIVIENIRGIKRMYKISQGS